MAIRFEKRTLMLGLGLAVLAGILVGLSAGDLEPWAPPGPTMRPLDSVEPRRIIWSESLSSEGRFQITEPGSYFLGEDIDATGRWGIEITSSDVTLDLNGFALRNGLGTGIRTPPAVPGIERVTVRNGAVQGWDSHGIELSSYWGDYVVRDVVSNFNGGFGIYVEEGMVLDCVAESNAADGIVANYRSRVKGCTAYANGNNGIQVGYSSIVSECISVANDANGIRLDGYSVAVGNISQSNLAAGIRALHGYNRIEANQVTLNPWGIQLVDNGDYDNVVVRNSVALCSQQAYDVGSGNDVGPIGTAATATSPWANFEH